jgi:hypothetical protein
MHGRQDWRASNARAQPLGLATAFRAFTGRYDTSLRRMEDQLKVLSSRLPSPVLRWFRLEHDATSRGSRTQFSITEASTMMFYAGCGQDNGLAFA